MRQLVILGSTGRNIAAGMSGGVGYVLDLARHRVNSEMVDIEPLDGEDALWPDGERVDASQDPVVAKLLDDAALAGAGMRAIVVVKNGRIVAERYGDGFSATVPLLGWSMTKTVTAALIGLVLVGFAAFVLPVGLTVLAIGNSSFSWFYDYGWFTGSLLGAALYYVFAGLAARSPARLVKPLP